MSVRLIVEEYLSLMREQDELDVFLPILLSAMKHEIVFKPSRGRQYGVDIVSRGPGPKGRRALHIWVVKCGEVDRAVWSVGENSIRHSLQEIGDIYLESHVLPEDKELPKVVYAITNGVFNQKITHEVSTYLNQWSKKHGAKTQLVNGSKLSAWTEKFLLDEFALPTPHRSIFRKLLVTVEDPSVAYQHGVALVRALLTESATPARTKNLKQKKLLTALRAILLVNTVLKHWARSEGNLEAAYRVGEFSLLAVWCHLCTHGELDNAPAGAVFQQVLIHHVFTAENYHAKLEPYYTTQSAFSTAYPDSALVADRVFEELGRLGLLATVYYLMGPNHAPFIERARAIGTAIARLISTHTISGSPCFDRQTIDITLAVMGLLAGGQRAIAEQWIHHLVDRLGFAKRLETFAPISSDSFEDLMDLRHGALEAKGMYTISTLIPVLGSWCELFKLEATYELLVKHVAPLFQDVTYNAWSPDADYENVLQDGQALKGSGSSDAFLTMPPNYDQLEALLADPADLPPIDSFQFIKYDVPWVSLIGSRHFQAQIPHRLGRLVARKLLSINSTSATPELDAAGRSANHAA
jgi:hypothetical protein